MRYLRGLIPARAGTTARFTPSKLAGGAHPRSRGDHFLADDFAARRWGSSPLARGPPKLSSIEKGAEGLIPARAGTTCFGCPVGQDGGAHPRSRGDHVMVVVTFQMFRGSSPLARGPPGTLLSTLDVDGLIPARAGTTILPMGFYGRTGAHPRSRGDHEVKWPSPQ